MKKTAKNLDEVLGMKYEAPKEIPMEKSEKKEPGKIDSAVQSAKDAAAPVTAAIGSGIATAERKWNELTGKQETEQQSVHTVASFRDGRYYIIGSHGKPLPIEYKDFPSSVQKAIERYKNISEKSNDYLLLLQAFASKDMSEDWNKKLDAFIQSIESGKLKQEEMIPALQSLIKETGSKDAPKLIEYIEARNKQELYLYIKNELEGYALISDRLIDGFIGGNKMHGKIQDTFHTWKSSAWDESKISDEILSSKAKERLKEKREEVAKLSVTTYTTQFQTTADTLIQSGDKRSRDTIVEQMKKSFIEKSNLLALKYEYVYDEVKKNKIPESKELELFKDIEGIGWNHVADKNADWWKF